MSDPTEQPTRGVTTAEPDLVAIARILKALAPLDLEAQARVLVFVNIRIADALKTMHQGRGAGHEECPPSQPRTAGPGG